MTPPEAFGPSAFWACVRIAVQDLPGLHVHELPPRDPRVRPRASVAGWPLPVPLRCPRTKRLRHLPSTAPPGGARPARLTAAARSSPRPSPAGSRRCRPSCPRRTPRRSRRTARTRRWGTAPARTPPAVRGRARRERVSVRRGSREGGGEGWVGAAVRTALYAFSLALSSVLAVTLMQRTLSGARVPHETSSYPTTSSAASCGQPPPHAPAPPTL